MRPASTAAFETSIASVVLPVPTSPISHSPSPPSSRSPICSTNSLTASYTGACARSRAMSETGGRSKLTPRYLRGIAEATPLARRRASAALAALAGAGDVLGAEDPAGAVADPERAGAAPRPRRRPPARTGLGAQSSRLLGQVDRAAGPRRRSAPPGARRRRPCRRSAGTARGRPAGTSPVGPVAVLGDDQLGLAGIGVLVVLRGPVDERRRRPRPARWIPLSRRSERIGRLSGRSSGARESCETPITGTFSSRARIFRPRLIWPTCSTRLTRGSSGRISCM